MTLSEKTDTLSKKEAGRIIAGRVREERQRLAAQLESEKAAREQAENALRRRERAENAARELRSRHLPESLLPAVELSDDAALSRSIDALESDWRFSVNAAVRERLGGGDEKTSRPVSLKGVSYAEAAALYKKNKQ